MSLIWKWEKHKGGGWIVFAFSPFSPIEVTGQKQLDYSFWSDVQILNAADKKRERLRERERESEREREREREREEKH